MSDRITPDGARALAAEGWVIAGRWSGDQYVLKRSHDGRTEYGMYSVGDRLSLEILENATRVAKKEET